MRTLSLWPHLGNKLVYFLLFLLGGEQLTVDIFALRECMFAVETLVVELADLGSESRTTLCLIEALLGIFQFKYDLGIGHAIVRLVEAYLANERLLQTTNHLMRSVHLLCQHLSRPIIGRILHREFPLDLLVWNPPRKLSHLVRLHSWVRLFVKEFMVLDVASCKLHRILIEPKRFSL